MSEALTQFGRVTGAALVAAGSVALLGVLQQSYPDRPTLPSDASEVLANLQASDSYNSVYDDLPPKPHLPKKPEQAPKLEITPSAPLFLDIATPAIGRRHLVIKPMDGVLNQVQTSELGKPVYDLHPPTEHEAYYWTLRGEPHSTDITAQSGHETGTTYILGHASDVGRNLIFQFLSQLKKGDIFSLTTADGVFEYTIDIDPLEPAKQALKTSGIFQLKQPYDKGVVLIACLPDTNNNVAVVGRLTAFRAIAKTLKTPDTNSTPQPNRKNYTLASNGTIQAID